MGKDSIKWFEQGDVMAPRGPEGRSVEAKQEMVIIRLRAALLTLGKSWEQIDRISRDNDDDL